MKKYLFGITGFIILFAADRITKILAEGIKGTEGIPVIKGVFRLLYLENKGAAFGIMQGRRFLLLAITIIILALVAGAFIRIPFTKRYIPMDIILIMLLSGAAGNMYDRIKYGYVTDFLYFELIDFPIFNVADCYVVIAAFAAAFYIMFYYNDEDLEIFRIKKRA